MSRIIVTGQRARLAIPLSLVLVGTAFAGCGGSSDEAQIRATMSKYLVAAAKGDSTTTCNLMTENGRRAMVTTANSRISSYPQVADCAGAVAAIADANHRSGLDAVKLAALKKEELADDDLAKIHIDGDTATVEFIVGDSPEPTVKHVAGSWKVDDLGTGTS